MSRSARVRSSFPRPPEEAVRICRESAEAHQQGQILYLDADGGRKDWL